MKEIPVSCVLRVGEEIKIFNSTRIDNVSQITEQFTATLVAASIAVLVASSAAANYNTMTTIAETCEASWYGPGLENNPMANGHTFHMENATVVAHKELPFGSQVLVVNQDNGKYVILEVQDRGPFVEGRCVDLSKAAGRNIGLGSGNEGLKGLVPVKVIVLPLGPR